MDDCQELIQTFPTTPIAFISSLLDEMRKEVETVFGKDGVSTKFQALLELASQLSSGLVPYAIDNSMQPSTDSQKLMSAIRALDYDGLYQSGKTGDMHFYPEVSCDAIQGGLLKMLVSISRARRVLEIGTFMGYAALNMAEGLPSDGSLVTLEILPFFAEFCQDFFNRTAHKDRIEILRVDAIKYLSECQKNGLSFDFIFIDAADSQYKDYVKLILDENLLAPQGFMAIDNTLFKGSTYVRKFPKAHFPPNGHCLDEFNTFLKEEPRIEQVLLPIRDGLTIARKVNQVPN